MTAAELTAIAPRLCRAYLAHEGVLRARDKRRRRLTTKRLQAERMVAHRELQLTRSLHTDHGRYIARRQRKLKSAHSLLAHFNRLLDEVDAWEPLA